MAADKPTSGITKTLCQKSWNVYSNCDITGKLHNHSLISFPEFIVISKGFHFQIIFLDFSLKIGPKF